MNGCCVKRRRRFGADGPDRVGVAALMKRAGLTHGGFYAHWTSRDALLTDAIDWMFAEGSAAWFAYADGQNPPALLTRYVSWYLSMAHRDGRARGCPLPILTGEQHRLPAAAQERFAIAVARMTGRIAAQLERAGVDDASGRAASAVAEMVGAVGLARALDTDAASALLDAARVSVWAKLDLPAPADAAST